MQNIKQNQNQYSNNRPPHSSFPGFSTPGYDREYRDLFSFIAWLVGTSVPVTTMIVLIGVFSGSLTIIAITMDYGLSLCLNIMSLFTLGAILRKNTFKYPYGTGKYDHLGFSAMHGCGMRPAFLNFFNQFVCRPQCFDFLRNAFDDLCKTIAFGGGNPGKHGSVAFHTDVIEKAL